MTAATPRTGAGPVRVALIGAGGIAQTHALASQRLDGLIEVVAVADVDAAAAQALAERLGCDHTADPASLVDAGRVDLALVATPPDTHVELACAFLSSGIATLVEKPLAIGTTAARRIAGCAQSSGALLTMASKYRFATDVVRARSLVAGDALGDVVRVENAFSARVDMAGRWNSDPARSGGGVLIDNGTHSVDIARFLAGPVTEVLAVEGRRVQGLAVEDTVTLLLRTDRDVLVSIDLSWSLDRMTDRYLAVVGTRGTVEVGWQGARFRTVGSATATDIGTGWDKVQALAANLANVARAVRGEEALVVGWEDALASVQVVEAAYSSLRTGGWEKVEQL